MGVNEVQRLDINSVPATGTFVLAFNGSAPTSGIAAKPSAGQVQSALEALSTIGVGNVVVSPDGSWTSGYVCSFQNALGSQDLPLLTADAANLKPSGKVITVSVVTEGQGDIEEPPPDIEEPPPDIEEPPDTGVPPVVPTVRYVLPTPCTAQDLQLWSRALGIVLPGAVHAAAITSDGSGITASW